MISGSPRPKLIPGTHLKVKSINAKNIGLYKPIIKRGSSQKKSIISSEGEKLENGQEVEISTNLSKHVSVGFGQK